MSNVLVPPRFEDIIADAEMYFASQSARATDFNPGSIVRTIIEIVAQIQERRDVAVWSGLNRAVDEAVFDAWGFVRQEAQPATGQVTLYPGVGVTTAFSLRQGDLFRVPNSPTLIYQAISPTNNPDGTNGWTTTTGTVWTSNPAISAATLNVRALVSGTSGNVGAKLVTEAISTIPGIAQIKNLQAFTNGVDASTDADRRAAFTAYIQSLPRGTVQSLKYGAKTAALLDSFGLVIEQIRKVNIVEGTSPATVLTQADLSTVSLSSGHVGVFVDNGVGVLSTELKNLCQNVLDGYIDEQGVRHDGWRSAGIVTTVYSARRRGKAVTLDVTVARGFQLEQVSELVKVAIQNMFNILDVGETLLYNDLLMFIKLVPGVLDVQNLQVAGGVVNVDPADNELITLDTILGTASFGTGASVAIRYPLSL